MRKLPGIPSWLSYLEIRLLTIHPLISTVRRKIVAPGSSPCYHVDSYAARCTDIHIVVWRTCYEDCILFASGLRRWMCSGQVLRCI